jgi:hypothetical protein
MDIIIIFLWILGVSAFSLFGAWYVRRYAKPDALIGLYVAVVLISNIVAYKIVNYDFGFLQFYAPAATIIFAVTFLLTDIVNEKFGRRETQRMIFIAFLSQIAVAFFIYLALSLDAAPFFTDNDAFVRILGFAPRIMIASWIAFLISENTDAWIFSWFKKKTNGKYLWMRNAFSSLPSMVLDSVIFVSIAFFGVQALLPLIIGNIVIKWIVGVVDIPFMYLNRRVMG